ncbi:hypothetical protein [Limimaricola hongkongensis]|uniref:Uncharacterized protein n=1 Tax=Limimaricola hongkongensis DSM 17492 TaxID=1122180 RepID=A0A017HBA5_9RHOB|nr:hypothetical protein [Limimaricola hongkongensis]EYD71797.1 hypothetical protein Lokhon_01867 [Limimaricola hongkongensis DSM 17492]
MDIKLTYDETGNHIRFEQAVEKLGDRKKAHDAFRRGINHTGDKAWTKVRRSLAKQMGLSLRDLDRHGKLRRYRANYGQSKSEPDQSGLEYRITSTGRAIPLKYFKAKQFKGGVKASPWGNRRLYPGLFINAGTYKSGKFVGGGHVFRNSGAFSQRSGRENLPKMGYGPAARQEMVKDQSRQAFADVALELGPRIEHEVLRLTDGVVG